MEKLLFGCYNRKENCMGKRRKTYDELTFVDDFMFCEVLREHPEICQKLAGLVTDRKVNRVSIPETQKQEKFLAGGKGVRFDIYFEDDANTVYDLEMQTTLKAQLPKRTRYYSSMLDMDHLRRGKTYAELPSAYIVFICLEDPFEGDICRYTFQNCCTESPELFLQDGRTIIFINAASLNGASPELQHFLDYLNGKKPDSDLTRMIDNAVQDQRDNEKGRRKYMTLEEHYQEEREEGREEGKEDLLLEMVSTGEISPENGARHLNISTQEFLQRLAESGLALPAKKG